MRGSMFLAITLILTSVTGFGVGSGLANDDRAVPRPQLDRVTHQEIGRRFFDEFHGRGDLAVADELVAPNAVAHTPEGELSGPGGIKGFANLLHTTFPDAEFMMRDLVVDGNMVVARWMLRGEADRPFPNLAPTGEPATLSGITMLRIVDGMIAEAWVAYHAEDRARQQA